MKKNWLAVTAGETQFSIDERNELDGGTTNGEGYLIETKWIKWIWEGSKIEKNEKKWRRARDGNVEFCDHVLCRWCGLIAFGSVFVWTTNWNYWFGKIEILNTIADKWKEILSSQWQFWLNCIRVKERD